jgi:hypothetical protein
METAKAAFEDINNKTYELMTKALHNRFKLITPTIFKFIREIRMLYRKLNTNFRPLTSINQEFANAFKGQFAEPVCGTIKILAIAYRKWR